ncbi:MAG: hypothetical protein AAGA93_24240 [Actinomycetota bacterium]
MLGLSLRAAAGELEIGASTLSGWERDLAAPTLDPRTIDRRLDAGGALGDLLWSVGTPDGLVADTLWTTVFRGESDATWIWVRPLDPSTPLEIVAEWGIATVGFPPIGGPGGAVIWTPFAMPEQPMIVRLSAPGWVDFGQGRPPTELAGVPVINSVERVRRVAYPSHALGDLTRQVATSLVTRRLANGDVLDRFPVRFRETLLRLEPQDHRPNWVEDVPGLIAPMPDVQRHAFRRLRDARGLSYRAAAERLGEVLGVRVGADTVRRFESDGSWAGRTPDLDAALDGILGAGGRLACRPVAAAAGIGTIRFPSHWLGPVWIEFNDVSRSSFVRFTWGRWWKDVHLRAPTVLTTHCLQPHLPLRVELPQDVAWRAGIGRRPGARRIDRNWVPTTPQFAAETYALALDRGAKAFDVPRDLVRTFFGR